MNANLLSKSEYRETKQEYKARWSFEWSIPRTEENENCKAFLSQKLYAHRVEQMAIRKANWNRVFAYNTVGGFASINLSLLYDAVTKGWHTKSSESSGMMLGLCVMIASLVLFLMTCESDGYGDYDHP